jgi:hypothetical protein
LLLQKKENGFSLFFLASPKKSFRLDCFHSWSKKKENQDLERENKNNKEEQRVKRKKEAQKLFIFILLSL